MLKGSAEKAHMNDYNSENKTYYPSQSYSAPGSIANALPRTAATVSLSERLSFIRKVYALFFIGILFAIAGVFIGFAYPPLMIAVIQHPFIGLIALLGGVMGAQAVRHQPGVNIFALFGFTTLTGVIISP